MRREVVGDESQGDETARALSTLVKDTDARDRHRRIRHDRLHVQERHGALRGVFASVAGREVQILIHSGVRYVLHGIASRYVGFAELQLGPEKRK